MRNCASELAPFALRPGMTAECCAPPLHASLRSEAKQSRIVAAEGLWIASLQLFAMTEDMAALSPDACR